MPKTDRGGWSNYCLFQIYQICKIIDVIIFYCYWSIGYTFHSYNRKEESQFRGSVCSVT